MFLTIATVLMIVLGVFLVKYSDYVINDVMLFVGICIVTVGSVGLVITTIFIVNGHVGVDQKIILARMERQCIEDQVEILDNGCENVSTIKVIKCVHNWNAKVASTKYWFKNPCTNWFYSKRYVNSLNYIEFGGIKNEFG